MTFSLDSAQLPAALVLTVVGAFVVAASFDCEHLGCDNGFAWRQRWVDSPDGPIAAHLCRTCAAEVDHKHSRSGR